MKDYEQLYYDSQYEIKKLKKRIEELETDIEIIKSNKRNKAILILKQELIKEIDLYFKKNGDDEKNEQNVQN